MFFGIVILILGVIFLLNNLGIITGEVWPIIWPCLIIAFGLAIVCRRKKRDDKWRKFGENMRKVGEEMHSNFGKED